MPVPDKPRPGQESVWDYPRPPRLEEFAGSITVELGGQTIAITDRAWRVLETSHPPTYYLPQACFGDGVLQQATGSSWCEWKGPASYFDLVIASDRELLRSALNVTFAGTPSRVELTFERHDRGVATRRLVAVAMSRLPEADPPSVLLVGRDVTNEREMRLRLMETDRLAAIGELVAGVAHEVNNPLSSISAFAQLMLRDGGLTATQRESVEIIKSETVRASQVVKDLLAFARRREPLHELVDLNGVITRTLRLRGYQMSTNQISVETDLAPDLPNVAGDARQLQQVCLNLVINAVQAMTATGGGTLRLSTRYDKGSVVMDVRDSGPGIPDATKARIFEPFFTTKDEGEGTGLGLSVSYGIVTAHGGTIEAAETSPSGTTIRVTLPSREVL